jgi:hypothetical protein
MTDALRDTLTNAQLSGAALACQHGAGEVKIAQAKAFEV